VFRLKTVLSVFKMWLMRIVFAVFFLEKKAQVVSRTSVDLPGMCSCQLVAPSVKQKLPHNAELTQFKYLV
jgi:hypothetical protein